MSTEYPEKSVEEMLAGIEKAYGKGSIMRLGDRKVTNVETISTGLIGLDLALGIGGLPRGRIIECYGSESSGKSTLALQLIAQAQKTGLAAYIDAEHALDLSYAQRLGVNVSNLLLSQPDCGEQALDICEALVRAGSVHLVIIDSVAALTPRAEIEGQAGDAHVGLQARMMSQAMRKLTAAISRSKTTVFFINQTRIKIGVMYGNPTTTTGGNALKYYASVRIEINKGKGIERGEKNFIGTKSNVKIVKNKLAAPFKTVELDLIFGEGLSREASVLQVAGEIGLITKSGVWYSYGDTKLGQGSEKAREFLLQHPEITAEIEAKIRAELLAPPDAA